MFDRFSVRARKAMSAARQAAQAHRHDYIGPEHMLLGLLEDPNCMASVMLRAMAVSPERLRTGLTTRMRGGRKMVTMGQLPFSPAGRTVLMHALEEAQNFGHAYIGTEHILLGVIRAQATVTEPALAEAAVNVDAAREQVIAILGARDPDPPEEQLAIPPRKRVGPPFAQVMESAAAAVRELGDPAIESEHVLLGLFATDGVARRILRELGATPEGVRVRIKEMRGE